MIICDWTSYKLDHHISACVQSYAVSRGYKQIAANGYDDPTALQVSPDGSKVFVTGESGEGDIAIS